MKEDTFEECVKLLEIKKKVIEDKEKEVEAYLKEITALASSDMADKSIRL